MLDLLTQVAVLATAAVVSSSAVYVGKVASEFKETVNNNEQRSKENRRWFVGGRYVDGVLTRLDRVESEVNDA